MAPTPAPRIAQVEELTRGVSLPLRPMTNVQMGLIVSFLRLAWHGLMADQPAALSTDNEVGLNTLLLSRLNYLLRQTDWHRRIKTVRAGITANFDGSHLERRPDMEIDVPGGTHGFPITIECKIIEHHQTRTIENYCLLGLDRFIAGTYAWGKREGFMLAFVRNDAQHTELKTHLDTAMGETPPLHSVVSMPQQVDGLGLDISESLHDRTFRYPLQQPPQNIPGPIKIWHVWLRV